MFRTLLVSAAIACAAVTARAQSERSTALELVVRVQESRLSLFNPTDAPELIVLADRVHGRHATITIAPHAELDYRFASRALEGLDFAVFARDAAGLRTSGWHQLATLRGQNGDQTTCFNACREHVHAWRWSAGAWLPLDGEDSSNTPQHCAIPPPAAPHHVPVITPTDGQHGDLPPRLEKPLPPV